MQCQKLDQIFSQSQFCPFAFVYVQVPGSGEKQGVGSVHRLPSLRLRWVKECNILLMGIEAPTDILETFRSCKYRENNSFKFGRGNIKAACYQRPASTSIVSERCLKIKTKQKIIFLHTPTPASFYARPRAHPLLASNSNSSQQTHVLTTCNQIEFAESEITQPFQNAKVNFEAGLN
jgi:hypothetical protein